jgi:hypothetical protein
MTGRFGSITCETFLEFFQGIERDSIGDPIGVDVNFADRGIDDASGLIVVRTPLSVNASMSLENIKPSASEAALGSLPENVRKSDIWKL